MTIRARQFRALILVPLVLACGDDDAGTGPESGGDAVARSLTIAPGTATLTAIADTARLAAEVRDQDGRSLAGATVSWSSLDEAVATVSGAGVVTAVAEGTARIVARSGTPADTALVTVEQVPALIAVSPASRTLTQGDTVRLAAVIVDANGYEVDGGDVVWSSDDEGLASVDSTGLVTAGAYGGETNVRATAGSVDGATAIAVLDRIVFHTLRDSNYEIYVMNADGSDETRLTDNGATDFAPAWSPDATSIVFRSNQDGNEEIYVIGADGSGLTNLTNHAGNDSNPVWSPDGSRIAFESDRDGNLEVYVMDADGGGQTNVTSSDSMDVNPVWGPRGLQLGFASRRDGNDEIYIANVDGSNPRNVTNHPATDFEPVASPDGTQLAFVSKRDTVGGLAFDEIWVINPDGTGAANVSQYLTNSDDQPVWSPDGTRIAFRSFRDGNHEIYVMNADGSGQVNVTNSSAPDGWPAWSPDGTRLAFERQLGSQWQIFAVNADGTGLVQLTSSTANSARPAWQPRPNR